MPRPRARELGGALARDGALVDSYTNILTVKLFARLADEDAYVRESIDDHRAAMSRHMRLITRFHFCLTAMNAALPSQPRRSASGLGAGRGGRRDSRGIIALPGSSRTSRAG